MVTNFTLLTTGILVRVFTYDLGDWGSIPGWVIQKTFKKWDFMRPCFTLSIIRYGSRVKWSNPRIGVVPSPTPRCSSYWKGSLLVAFDNGHTLLFLRPFNNGFKTTRNRWHIKTFSEKNFFFHILLIHTHIHEHLYLRAHTHTHIYKPNHTPTHIYTYSYTHIDIYPHTRTHMHIYIYTQTLTHIHTHTHSCIHIRTHIHSHTWGM